MTLSVNKTTIFLTRGDTAKIQLTLTEPGGEPYQPEPGDEIRFAACAAWGEPPLIEVQIPTDTLLLTLEPADTKPLAFGQYWYDIQLTRAGGDVDTFIAKAKLVLTEEVK